MKRLQTLLMRFVTFFLKIRNNTKFVSIIDADYYLFGLIFWKLYMERDFDKALFDKLNEDLAERIKEIKKDAAYQKKAVGSG